MMRNILTVIFCFSVLCSCQKVSKENIWQNYEVYRAGEKYHVKGSICDRIVFKSSNASKAIDAAIKKVETYGGQILLSRGEFLFNEEIIVPSFVTLAGSGPATKLILQPDHATGIGISCREVNKVVIKNLLIKTASDAAAKTAVLMESCGDSKIVDITCLGFEESGITLSNNSFLCEINGCHVAGIKGSGILLEKLARGGRAGEYIPNLVSNCMVYGCKTGIETNRAIVLNIVGCQVYQTDGYGFYINNTSNSVCITGCRTFQIKDHAVVVENSHEINISSNIFCWSTGHGIVLDHVIWGTISANNIIDVGSVNLYDPAEDSMKVSMVDENFLKAPTPEDTYDLYNGIHIVNGTKGISVSSNAIFNWTVVPPMKNGIIEASDCSDNIITGNNINWCKTGISSNGKNTLKEGNIVKADEPYYGKPSDRFQFIHTGLLEKYIQEVMN